MACNKFIPCKEIPKDFALCVCRHDPDGSCQKTRVSNYSPGPVADEEHLARFVFYPTHIADSDLCEALFSDAFTYGASCNRKSYCCDEGQIHACGMGLQHERRVYRGYVTLSVSVLRGSGVRVYDTALEDNRCHADIVACPDIDKPKRKAIRIALLKHARENGVVRYC